MRKIIKVEEHKRARELRELGWTLKAIATEIGVHRDTVREWTLDLPPIRHRLIDIDIEKRTATCLLCGPTRIRKSGPKWLCRQVVQKIYKENLTRSQRVFYEYLCRQSCMDCGNSNPIVLEFDHVQPKTYNVSDMVNKGYKWDSILREIEKCEIVCANCHRIRTNERGAFYRHTKS